ncbi:DUF4810 domain-containing protein [Cupriavidus sp. UYPR2.512]|uniref:DUF4810 domain-containing protein n=1 Tax=Cupriavidus sp. UYPR2.512 TaxID=1080187 RepID=UPI0003664832|nr:DUF4810 domain-containing protein [Cupriavidus sp. UYPR2.512]UIF90947.1 DUF4810 domain-containing protein [Cupriavidus necator]
MKRIQTTGVLLAAALLSACAPQQKYAWGSYEPALYTYYKTPAASEAFAEQLNKTITTAESSGTKVPPGLYAEYGNVLLEQGKGKEAVVWFEKEKAAWPESAVLMTRMVQIASGPRADKPKAKDATPGSAQAAAAAPGQTTKQ